MLLTVTKRPDIDATTSDEEQKYRLFRPMRRKGLLPDPGTRRFSEFFMRRALKLDTTFDAQPAEDQSEWDDHDVHTEDAWRAWGGML